jgi:DNA-binding CsgD family transcriptional regulator/PAS domain-containing protein
MGYPSHGLVADEDFGTCQVMPPFSSRLLQTVEAIYDAAPDPTQWPRALAEIAGCFDDVGAIIQWRRDDGSFGAIASDSLLEAQRDYVEQGWSRKDIKAERSEQSGCLFSGEPFSDRHIGSEIEIQNSPFSTQFLAKHGLGWFGAVTVSPDPHILVGLSIQRDSRTKPPYSDTELEMLALIGRHVEKSLRLSIRLLDAELANLGFGEALTRIGIGVFALDSMGRVVFSNPAAQRLVGDPLDIVDGHLRIRVSAARTAFDDAITRALRGSPDDLTAEPKPVLVHSAASDRRVVIYLLPISIATKAEHVLTQSRVIVLVIEQKSGEPADPAVVRDVLGLTLGEARIAALVGSGLAPREAAERLGIAEETARSVLKRVFGKVGVSRQGELVALLSKLVLR